MRRIAALVSTGLLAVSMVAPLSAATAATADAALTVSVANMNPWVPTQTKSEQPLSITVRLQNKTASDIDDVTLVAGRGVPVAMQDRLNDSLSGRKLPTDLLPIPARPAPRSGIDVPAGDTVATRFRTTTTTSYPAQGLCLCANAVYPIYISAVDSTTGTVLGFTRTFVAATKPDGKETPLQKVDVAWVWPLIDRPHRLTDANLFTDNLLPAELAPTGRLTRALQVVKDVGASHPVTLVIDPELVDEVTFLSSGDYSYLSSAGRTVRGTKVVAAGMWLTTLREALSYNDVTPEFTPYADPDVRSLSSAHLPWHPQMPPTMLGRVQRALDLTAIPSTLSWPPGGVASQRTLTRIAADGATSVLLDGSSVRPSNLGGLPASTAKLHTAQGTLSAALTSSAIRQDVASSIRNRDPSNLSHLPSLLAELAIRADTKPYRSRVAVLSAPRYVDPDVFAADTAIRETTASAVSEPAALATAFSRDVANESAKTRTRHVPSSTPRLSPGLLGSARRLTRSIPAVTSLLTGPGQSIQAKPLLTNLSRGLQRIESAAYLPTSTTGDPTDGRIQAARLDRQVTGLLQAVHIVRPESGRHAYSYSLASSNSPLPITVDNPLPYRVFVHIDVETVGGLPGLTTKDLGTKSIAADSKQTLRVPAHVQRSGRVALTATLTTADGSHVLGPRVRLIVHSTVFGTIGIVITVVAAFVLFLALAVRYVRRIQRLRRKRRASPSDQPVPAKVSS